MEAIAILAGAALLCGTILNRKKLFKHKKKTATCPHDLCKYKLPWEGVRHSGGYTFKEEQCPSCMGWVVWKEDRDDNSLGRYVRIEEPSWARRQVEACL
ncbi:hypothetical protein [Myxococcus phage Mx1]|nr:hypothetical protein [Myxococcus phage Mx1]